MAGSCPNHLSPEPGQSDMEKNGMLMECHNAGMPLM